MKQSAAMQVSKKKKKTDEHNPASFLNASDDGHLTLD